MKKKLHKTDIPISIEKKNEFQRSILRWSEKNLIDYPWRKNGNPYRVMISEILLTRTNANQVIPVYKKFTENYPTLKSFFKARLDDIKIVIKSLGLINRAEKLIGLKMQLISQFMGRIPRNFAELKSLHGIGDYNANAIMCFGFIIKRPLLDTNFIRIFDRVFNIKSKTKTPKTDKFLWDVAELLLPDSNFINYNYGILDICRIICKVNNPKCNICPISKICANHTSF